MAIINVDFIDFIQKNNEYIQAVMAFEYEEISSLKSYGSRKPYINTTVRYYLDDGKSLLDTDTKLYPIFSDDNKLLTDNLFSVSLYNPIKYNGSLRVFLDLDLVEDYLSNNRLTSIEVTVKIRDGYTDDVLYDSLSRVKYILYRYSNYESIPYSGYNEYGDILLNTPQLDVGTSYQPWVVKGLYEFTLNTNPVIIYRINEIVSRPINNYLNDLEKELNGINIGSIYYYNYKGYNSISNTLYDVNATVGKAILESNDNTHLYGRRLITVLGNYRLLPPTFIKKPKPYVRLEKLSYSNFNIRASNIYGIELETRFYNSSDTTDLNWGSNYIYNKIDDNPNITVNNEVSVEDVLRYQTIAIARLKTLEYANYLYELKSNIVIYDIDLSSGFEVILASRNLLKMENFSKDSSKDLTLFGYLREQCSVLNPVIKIETNNDANIFNAYNCMYIPSFGRVYNITDIISIRAGLVEIHAQVNVIKSHYRYVKEINPTVLKVSNPNFGNNLLADNNIPMSVQRVEESNFFNVEPFIVNNDGTIRKQYTSSDSAFKVGWLVTVLSSTIPPGISPSLLNNPQSGITQTTYYFDNISDFRKFKELMLKPTFWEGFITAFSELSEFIFNIKLIPFDLRKIARDMDNTSTYETLTLVTVGPSYGISIDIGNKSFTPDFTCYRIDSGSLNLNFKCSVSGNDYFKLNKSITNDYRNSFLATTPYSTYQLILPFIGTVQIDDFFLTTGHRYLKYNLDVWNGDVIATINDSYIESSENQIRDSHYFTGNIYIDLPFGSTNQNDIYERYIAFGSNTVSKAVEVAGSLATVAAGAYLANPTMIVGGGIGAVNGFSQLFTSTLAGSITNGRGSGQVNNIPLNNTKFYFNQGGIIRFRNKTLFETGELTLEEYGKLTGFLCNKPLNSIGTDMYITIDTDKLRVMYSKQVLNPSMTIEELSELCRILSNGVYI